jgi:predicted nucleic acid-binding protein
VSAVVDASVLVAATTDAGAVGAWAEDVLAEGGVVAPHLVLVEATNILRRLERINELTSLEATAAQSDLLHLEMLLVPFEPFAERVWELRRNVTSYDAWYIAAAEAFELPLVAPLTGDAARQDARQGRASQGHALAVGLRCRISAGQRSASSRSAPRRWPGRARRSSPSGCRHTTTMARLPSVEPSEAVNAKVSVPLKPGSGM